MDREIWEIRCITSTAADSKTSASHGAGRFTNEGFGEGQVKIWSWELASSVVRLSNRLMRMIVLRGGKEIDIAARKLEDDG